MLESADIVRMEMDFFHLFVRWGHARGACELDK